MGTEKRKSKEARRRKQRRGARDAHPPRLGHETMLVVAPPLRAATAAIIEHVRRPPNEAPELMCEEHLKLQAVDDVILGRYALARRDFGWSHEDAVLEVQQLATHIQCAVNFVVAGRKAFWVAPELVDLLMHTTLDISGDLLKLPFPACAFIFKDRATLDLAHAIADSARGASGMPFQVVTVYVFPIPAEYEEPGVRFVFLFDAFDGEWPYMIERDVPTDGARNIDEILNSHPKESSDPFFRTAQLAKMVHLAINAVLYTTSDGFHAEPRRPAPRKRAAQSEILSGETVFYLPGKIRVTHEAHADDFGLERQDTRRTVSKRFWVRGHWRRPNLDWKDQRLRWIAPYLKGPEMAVVVERAYELKGQASRSDADIG
jgi:hypothetical protein